MGYRSWLELFGRDTRDRRLAGALAEKGITASDLRVTRGDLSVLEDVEGEGITLTFTEASVIRPTAKEWKEPPVLTELSLFLAGDPSYGGALPFDLEASESKAAVRSRLGAPNESEEDDEFEIYWDAWQIDDLVLIVTYAPDMGAIDTVTVQLPES